MLIFWFLVCPVKTVLNHKRYRSYVRLLAE